MNGWGFTIVLITHEMKVIREILRPRSRYRRRCYLEEGSTLEVFTNPKKPTTKKILVGSSSKR